jgi:hypothetical protein
MGDGLQRLLARPPFKWLVATGNWLLTPYYRWRDGRLATRIEDNLALAATLMAAGKEDAARMLREHADRLKAAMRTQPRPRTRSA